MIHAYHTWITRVIRSVQMTKKDHVVPVRVTRRQKIALRRLARERGIDVSSLVRQMIDGLTAESGPTGTPGEAEAA